MTVRVAAVGDVHLGNESAPFRSEIMEVGREAELFLVAGDFTMWGAAEEGAVAAEALDEIGVPVIAVLGNHDFESDRSADVVSALEGVGVTVLECSSTTVDVGGIRVGVAGAKGFGGGFLGASASDFGEPEMKAFIRHTKEIAALFEQSLAGLHADIKIALLHYSPVAETLVGERLEIYPFLGSYLLEQAVDRGGADIVLHGHAHAGSPEGKTAGGIPVYNVAQQVIGAPYTVFELQPSP